MDAPSSAHERARKRLQQKLERSQKGRNFGLSQGRVVLLLAILTMSLGLAVLALALRLDLNGVEEEPPALALSQDGNEPGVHVLRAEEGLRWTDLRLDGNCTYRLNGAPLLEQLNEEVNAGDVLECAPGESLLIFSARDRGDAVLYQSTFPSDGPPKSNLPESLI